MILTAEFEKVSQSVPESVNGSDHTRQKFGVDHHPHIDRSARSRAALRLACIGELAGPKRSTVSFGSAVGSVLPTGRAEASPVEPSYFNGEISVKRSPRTAAD